MQQPPPVTYKNLLRPSVQVLIQSGKLLIDVHRIAAFLGTSASKVCQLCYTDRIPLPVRLPMTKVLRWSVFELLDWVENGCPGRRAWIATHGLSGSTRRAYDPG